MDPRNSQNPFARPPSQPSSRPTPPYTLQAPAQRLPPSLTNDPFLPRKIDHDHLRQEPPKSQLTQTPFTITSYAASLPRDALGTATDPTSQLPENGRSWARVQDEREVGYRSRGSEGKTRSRFIHLLALDHVTAWLASISITTPARRASISNNRDPPGAGAPGGILCTWPIIAYNRRLGQEWQCFPICFSLFPFSPQDWVRAPDAGAEAKL